MVSVFFFMLKKPYKDFFMFFMRGRVLWKKQEVSDDLSVCFVNLQFVKENETNMFWNETRVPAVVKICSGKFEWRLPILGLP